MSIPAGRETMSICVRGDHQKNTINQAGLLASADNVAETPSSCAETAGDELTTDIYRHRPRTPAPENYCRAD